MEISKLPHASSLRTTTSTTITTNSTTPDPNRLLDRVAYVVVLLLVVSTLLCLPHLVSAQEEESAFTNIGRLVQGGYLCSGNTSGSDLSARFDALKQVLLAQASVSLYAKSEDIDPVSGYGASVMYQCRGDLTLPDCASCVKTAFGTYPQPGCSVESSFLQVELQGCGVMYSNQSLEGGYYHSLVSLISSANHTQTYDQNRDIALANVTKQVIENKRMLGTYWAVDVVGDASTPEDICYALAQCHGYLPPLDCTSCLSLAIDDLDTSSEVLGARSYRGSCHVQYENNIFFSTNNTPSILTSLGPAPPSPSPSPLSSSSKGKRFSVVFMVVIGVVLFVVGSLLGWFSRLIWTHKKPLSNPLDFRKSNGVVVEEDAKNYVDLQHDVVQYFSLVQLAKATDNFKLENKIGQGGFGIVYLGILDNGVKVAIKKLMHVNNRGKEQFLNEVKLIRSLQHRNLVRLFGCCVEGDGDSRFLVYEYVSNQSLDKHLFGSMIDRDVLPWNKRREILVGVARGLTYLHHDSHLCIIHRDIKAGNILLDDDLEPKIADFGLAKLFASDRTHMSTRIAGTLGYIAPEYALNGQVSMKSDVFSFGLLMLEVISGRRIFKESSPLEQQYLLHWTWRLHQEGRELQILDVAMQQDLVEEEEIKKFIRVSLLCCQSSPSQRPSMLAVFEMLVNLSCVLDNPAMPTYLVSNNTIYNQHT